MAIKLTLDQKEYDLLLACLRYYYSWVRSEKSIKLLIKELEGMKDGLS